MSEPPEILPSTTTEGTPNALKTLFRTIHFAAMKHRHQTRKMLGTVGFEHVSKFGTFCFVFLSLLRWFVKHVGPDFALDFYPQLGQLAWFKKTLPCHAMLEIT